jgi:hypothetical protein
MATAGEFVMNVAAVRRLGPALLHMINSGAQFARGFNLGGLVDFARDTRDALNPLPGYAMGGMVGSIGAPAVAGGGGSSTPVHLHLEGKTFSMSAPARVAEELVTHARISAIVSGGRAPSRTGSG